MGAKSVQPALETLCKALSEGLWQINAWHLGMFIIFTELCSCVHIRSVMWCVMINFPVCVCCRTELELLLPLEPLNQAGLLDARRRLPTDALAVSPLQMQNVTDKCRKSPQLRKNMTLTYLRPLNLIFLQIYLILRILTSPASVFKSRMVKMESVCPNSTATCHDGKQ